MYKTNVNDVPQIQRQINNTLRTNQMCLKIIILDVLYAGSVSNRRGSARVERKLAKSRKACQNTAKPKIPTHPYPSLYFVKNRPGAVLVLSIERH